MGSARHWVYRLLHCGLRSRGMVPGLGKEARLRTVRGLSHHPGHPRACLGRALDRVSIFDTQTWKLLAWSSLLSAIFNFDLGFLQWARSSAGVFVASLSLPHKLRPQDLRIISCAFC